MGTTNGITPTFSGEMQLAGWSESHTSGCKVTFWLSSPDELEAFRALTVRKGNTAGHRFMAALVEIGDDELPVQSEPRQRLGALCWLAVNLCEDEDFWGFADVSNTEQARNFILATCQCDSRKDLDTNPAAAAKFENLIRKPFLRHMR